MRYGIFTQKNKQSKLPDSIKSIGKSSQHFASNCVDTFFFLKWKASIMSIMARFHLATLKFCHNFQLTIRFWLKFVVQIVATCDKVAKRLYHRKIQKNHFLAMETEENGLRVLARANAPAYGRMDCSCSLLSNWESLYIYLRYQLKLLLWALCRKDEHQLSRDIYVYKFSLFFSFCL